MSSSAITLFTRAEENLRFLLESAPDALVASDRQGRIILENTRLERLFGYPRDELLGKKVEVLMPRRFRRRHPAHRAAYFTDPKARRMGEAMELLGQRKDGTTFPIEVDLSPVEIQNQTFVWSAIRDISERRRVNEELQSADVLAANERRLSLAMDAGEIGTFDWDLVSGRIVWDGHHERLFGFEPGGFGGTYASFEERVHPDDLPGLNQAVGVARSTRSLFVREFRVVWPDGGVHWVLGRGEFLYDAFGNALRMHGVALGIDDRKRAEQALRCAEERFRNVLDKMLEGCTLFDFGWTFVYINEAAARYTSQEPADVVGRSMFEVYPGIEQLDVFARYRRCMEERIPQRFEEAFTTPDGGTRWFELSVMPVPEGIFVLSLETTDRRHAEKELRRSEERLRQAVRVSNIGIFDHDHTSDFIYWSPEQRAMYDWDPQTPVTVAGYLERVHPEDRDRVAAAVRRAHDPAGDGLFDIEHRLLRPDGSVRWTSIRSRTFFEGDGEQRHPVRTVGATTDITDRKQAEVDRAKLEAQLFEAQKMESIGRLAGGVAHDFNNLLTVINGYGELLLQRVDASNPIREPLTEIKKAGHRAAELTQQLLAFSRRQITLPKVLNLNHVITDIENLLRRLIGEDIALVTVLNPDLGSVKADPGHVCQVLMNLVANSRDAMPRGGRLRIETANVDLDDRYAKDHPEAIPGPYVQLTVSDSGIGMDAETRAHLFEPFFTTKKVGAGTGLGLATTYGVVKQAGGFIRVYSSPGKGAIFQIYLQRAKGIVETEGASRPPAANLHGKETILLVEDQPEIRELVRTILQLHGYRVLEAANADEALFRSDGWVGAVHLMLTDVIMPGMSGWDLANRLKPRRPEMKVVYMSGYSARASPGEFQEAGIDYIQKPFSPDDLVLKIREVLERPR
jgi:PAS domain S-box-containing protein